MLLNNINTKSYWDNRFVTGDWEAKLGRNQTREFAISQIKHLNISRDFKGTILDFGCGLGDAFPIYKETFPNARLIGLDISEEGVKKCKEIYSYIAEFICGDYRDVPKVDIIIASNVFKHLTDDISIAKNLLIKCRQLNIIVPYKEKIISGSEHINTYDENYFHDLDKYEYKIFVSGGWSQYGVSLIYHLYLKNILRPLFGKPIAKRAKQIIFKFKPV